MNRTLTLGICIILAIGLISPIYVVSAQDSPLADSPWPTSGQDFGNTRRSPISTHDKKGNIKWNFVTGSNQGSAASIPAVDSDGTIYVGGKKENYDPIFYAINPDGTQKWKIDLQKDAPNSRKLSMKIMGAPTVSSDGTIYFVLTSDIVEDQFLYAVDQEGNVEWNLNVKPIRSPPKMGPDGTIYVTGGNKLHAIDPEGTIKWNYTADGTFSTLLGSSPAIAEDGTIYAGVSNSPSKGKSKLIALDQEGNKKWEYISDKALTISPSVGNTGTVYTLTKSMSIEKQDADLRAVTPDGEEKWKFSLNSNKIIGPSIGKEGTVYVSGESKMYAINDDGTEKWNVDLQGDSLVSYPKLSKDGKIYFVNGDNLFCYDSNGEKKWSQEIDDIFTFIIGSEDTVYLYSYSDQSRLYAFGLEGENGSLPGFTTGSLILSITIGSLSLAIYRKKTGR